MRMRQVIGRQLTAIIGGLVCAILVIVTPSAALELPPSTATRITLDNGLVVLIEEDHAYPRVAFEVRVKGGSCDDTPWAGSGLAHLMEHMLFKGTERRAVGTIEPEVRRYEGNFNAFTSYDDTGFSLAVSSAHTHDGLDLLADVLFHSSFDPAELKKEQEVVRSEMRMNRDDPDRRLYQRFWNAAFQVHPYRHPVIGYEEIFNRLSRDDVLAFYRTRYVPNNMVLAIVGDVDAAQAREWVQQLYGVVPRGIPFDWSRAQEPPQITTRTVSESFPVKQALLMLGFHSTRLQDPELYPLDVLAQVLGAGESARLERRLRRKLKLVHGVSASNATPQDAGLFLISATVDADQIDAVREAILRELEVIRQEGVSPEELDRAKHQALAGFFAERQSFAARAGDLASNELLVGDYDFGRKYVEGIQRVTTDDIRRAAQRYLTDHGWTLATLTPPTPRVASHESRPANVQATPRVGFNFAQATLKNGIQVVVGEQHRTPLVAIRVMWQGGMRAESAETAGLSHLTAQMLLGGTAHHSAEALASAVENRGGALSAFSGKDGFGLSLDLLAEDTAFGLELLQEIMTQATFPPDEMEREKARTLAQLRAREDDIFEVTSDRMRQLLLGKHPYARHPLGTASTVERLTAADCRRFFQQQGVPEHMVLVIMGDVRSQELLAAVEQTFHGLSSQKAQGTMNHQTLQFPKTPVQDVLKLPSRQQAIVAWGYPGVAWAHRDRSAFEVVQALLSGSGGRLYQHLREQSGVSYTLGAAHVPGEVGGYFFSYVATVPAEVEHVSQSMQEEFAALSTTPPSVEEMELAKRALRDGYYEQLQHLGAVASRVALDVLLGLGTEELERYPNALAHVSREDVARVLKTYLGSSAYVQLRTVPESAASSAGTEGQHVTTQGNKSP